MVVKKFQKAENIRQDERQLKQAKFFNFELRKITKKENDAAKFLEYAD